MLTFWPTGSQGARLSMHPSCGIQAKHAVPSGSTLFASRGARTSHGRRPCTQIRFLSCAARRAGVALLTAVSLPARENLAVSNRGLDE